jgi:hypothetical protein
VAAKELVEASDAVHAHRGLLAKIGLIGASHNSDLARAKESFTHGNGDASRDASLAAENVVADASSAGTMRVGVVVGAIVLIVLLAWGGRKWSRRRGAKTAAAAAVAEPGLENKEVTTEPAG